MKRGFLSIKNTEVKLAADTDAPNECSIQKDKEKAKAETSTDGTESSSSPPLLDLHAVPPSVKSLEKIPKDSDRFVFRHWPRDPNGKTMDLYFTPVDPLRPYGKHVGSRVHLWGATLYDFYFFRPVPSEDQALDVSTGSELAHIMKELGELEHAKDELAWAAREACPREIPGWDPAEAIVAHEGFVYGGLDVADMLERCKFVVSEATGTKHEGYVDALGIPVESPFHPNHYPPPWPLVPFETPYIPYHLQRRLPLHLLPKKLYVHDPWKLAYTASAKAYRSYEGESWTSKTYRIRTYSLSFLHGSHWMAEKSAKAAAAAEDEALKTPETVFISPQETGGPTEQPAIRAFLPKRPRKLTEVPEAHLYLSPKGRLGTGNHSVVYEAELELPRDLFCQSTYCKTCLDEQIKVEVNRLKESGEWEQRMSEATREYQATKSGGSPSSSSVQIPPDYVGFVKVREERVPMETIDIVAAAPWETPAEDASSRHSGRVSDAVTKRYNDYEGPVVPLYPNVQWQNPAFPDTICEHEVGKKRPVPRTAKFLVAAKLSLPDDWHVEDEAANYLRFPPHFFQHWTGYNIVPPLHASPTCIGAIVPQFFGYYTPDALYGSDDLYKYRSSILLMELCGKSIRISELSSDERRECLAMLFRFHSSLWLYESFAERNILQQEQSPTCSPFEDQDECDIPHQHRRYSFRLIDFGRSGPIDSRCGYVQCSPEQMMAMSMMGLRPPY